MRKVSKFGHFKDKIAEQLFELVSRCVFPVSDLRGAAFRPTSKLRATGTIEFAVIADRKRTTPRSVAFTLHIKCKLLTSRVLKTLEVRNTQHNSRTCHVIQHKHHSGTFHTCTER